MKHLEASATGLKMFKQARLKLTWWYLIIIFGVSLFFSVLVYLISWQELNRQGLRWEKQMIHSRQVWQRTTLKPIRPGVDLIRLKEENLKLAQKHLIFSLIELNGLILVLASLSGWFLAGKTLEPIQKNMENQKLFVANAAHELKTPLTIMKTNLEVALDKKRLDSATKRVLADNLEEVDRLAGLVKELLFLSTVKRVRVSFQPTKIIKKVTKRFTNSARRKNIKLISQTGRDHQVVGDPGAIETVIESIVDNALKYTPAGGKIDLKMIKRKNWLIIKVTDTGIGIEADKIKAVQEPFYKIDQSRSRQENDSFGLGLALAKKIIDDHQGKLEIKSRKDQGTEVLVFLPIKK